MISSHVDKKTASRGDVGTRSAEAPAAARSKQHSSTLPSNKATEPRSTTAFSSSQKKNYKRNADSHTSNTKTAHVKKRKYWGDLISLLFISIVYHFFIVVAFGTKEHHVLEVAYELNFLDFFLFPRFPLYCTGVPYHLLKKRYVWRVAKTQHNIGWEMRSLSQRAKQKA